MQIEQTNEWTNKRTKQRTNVRTNERTNVLLVSVLVCMSMCLLCSLFVHSIYTWIRVYVYTKFIQFWLCIGRHSQSSFSFYTHRLHWFIYITLSLSKCVPIELGVQKELCENGKSFISFDCNKYCAQTARKQFLFELNNFGQCVQLRIIVVMLDFWFVFFCHFFPSVWQMRDQRVRAENEKNCKWLIIYYMFIFFQP